MNDDIEARVDAYANDYVASEEVFRRRSLQLGAHMADNAVPPEHAAAAFSELAAERERWFAVLRDYWEVWE